MKKALFIFSILGLLLFAATAQAGIQDFTLVNNTGYDIYYVYVSANTSQSWEEDVLGDQILYNGQSVNINFSGQSDYCYWDLKVIDEDQDSFEFFNIDLCTYWRITLNLVNGTYQATYE